MRVVWLTERADHSIRDGGTIRQSGLIFGLRKLGVEVDVRDVSGLRSSKRFTDRYEGVSARAMDADFGQYDVVHVEGFPLGSLLGQVRAQNANVIWDPCDSWALRYWTQFRQDRQIEHLGKSLACAALAARWRARRVIYITERDRRVDARFSATARREGLVVPNGVDIPKVPQGGSGGEISLFGDWNYPPNRQSLLWLGPMIPALRARTGRKLTIYGTCPMDLRECQAVFDENAHFMGHVPDLPAAYRRARIVLAPVVSGAGLKNKVLEPLCAGIPVITSSEGAQGLPVAPPWLSVVRSRSEFIEQVASWWEEPPCVHEGSLDLIREAVSWERSSLMLREAYR